MQNERIKKKTINIDGLITHGNGDCKIMQVSEMYAKKLHQNCSTGF